MKIKTKIILLPYYKEIIELEDFNRLKNDFYTIVSKNENLSAKTSNLSLDSKKLEGNLIKREISLRRLLKFGYSAFPLIVNGVFISNENNLHRIKLTYRFNNYVNIFISIAFVFIFWLLLNSIFSNYPSEVYEIVDSKREAIILSKFKSLLLLYIVLISIFNYELNVIRELAINLIIENKPNSADNK